MSPYKSKAQQRAMHAKANRGEISKATVEEFDEATKAKKGGFKALPEKVKSKKSKPKKREKMSRMQDAY